MHHQEGVISRRGLHSRLKLFHYSLQNIEWLQSDPGLNDQKRYFRPAIHCHRAIGPVSLPFQGKLHWQFVSKRNWQLFVELRKQSLEWLGQNIHDNFYENLYGGVHVHAYGNVCWNFKVVSFPDLLENLLTTAAAAGELVNTGWFF